MIHRRIEQFLGFVTSTDDCTMTHWSSETKQKLGLCPNDNARTSVSAMIGARSYVRSFHHLASLRAAPSTLVSSHEDVACSVLWDDDGSGPALVIKAVIALRSYAMSAPTAVWQETSSRKNVTVAEPRVSSCSVTDLNRTLEPSRVIHVCACLCFSTW